MSLLPEIARAFAGDCLIVFGGAKGLAFWGVTAVAVAGMVLALARWGFTPRGDISFMAAAVLDRGTWRLEPSSRAFGVALGAKAAGLCRGVPCELRYDMGVGPEEQRLSVVRLVFPGKPRVGLRVRAGGEPSADDEMEGRAVLDERGRGLIARVMSARHVSGIRCLREASMLRDEPAGLIVDLAAPVGPALAEPELIEPLLAAALELRALLLKA